jgi:hypothetical protein
MIYVMRDEPCGVAIETGESAILVVKRVSVARVLRLIYSPAAIYLMATAHVWKLAGS